MPKQAKASTVLRYPSFKSQYYNATLTGRVVKSVIDNTFGGAIPEATKRKAKGRG